MTRAEVLRQYAVNDHHEIVTPGVYEGEPVFAPYFYSAYRLGRPHQRCAHRNDGMLALFYEVTPFDRAQFPELKDVLGVSLFVDEDDGLAFFHLEIDHRRTGGRKPNLPYDEDEEDDEEEVEDEAHAS